MKRKLFIFIITIIFIAIYWKLHPIINEFSLKFKDKKELKSNFKKSIRLNSECKCKINKIIYLTYLQNDLLQVKYSYKSDELNINLNNTKTTCDLYNTLTHGYNQKVIGYSLYGKNKLYYNYLKDLTKLIKIMYPQWIIRIHYDDSIDQNVICDIECQLDENNKLYDNVVFCNTNKMLKSFYDINDNKIWSLSNIHKMMWRWLPLGDSFVDIFSSRDTDSLIIEREIDSVNVWLNSSKLGHIMRGIKYLH